MIRAGGCGSLGGTRVPGSVPGRMRGRRFHARSGAWSVRSPDLHDFVLGNVFNSNGALGHVRNLKALMEDGVPPPSIKA